MATKLILLGDCNTGKSSFLTRYIDNTFTYNVLPTVGLDYRQTKIKTNEKDVKLAIFDTAGQERFRSISITYIRYAKGIIIVFDVTDYSTFLHCRNWIKMINESSNVPYVKVLVGNKIDKEERKVEKEEALDMANEYGMAYFETSAATGEGVNEVFEYLVGEIVKMEE